MEIKKLTGALLAVNLVQVMIGVILLIVMGSRLLGEVSPVIWVCVGLILVSALMTGAGLLAAGRYQNRNYEESMKNLECFNGKLREQKHDLMNHFQVVYGLMELGEYEEAHAYIRPVFKEIKKLNMALKTAQPAVNALLQAKMEAAARQEIDFYLEVGSSLEAIPMQPWDLCRVLANLLDNAINALKEKEGEKRIRVSLKEARGSYLFEIADNGPAIPEENRALLFKPGFTTNKEEGHGNGLAIVARLLKEAGGEIFFESEEEETVFLVRLPGNRREERRERK